MCADVPDRVLVIGMMASGKSTVGRAVSQRLGWPYFDNDELLLRATGSDTRTLLERQGEAAMRRAESAALTVALTEGGPLVAGVAGGVVEDPLDRDRLRAGGFVVWLRASIETLVRRASGTDRPWLGDDPRAALTALYAGRADLYLSVASLVVDVDELPADAVADRIITSLQQGRCAPRPG
jgi:shikimate kinase